MHSVVRLGGTPLDSMQYLDLTMTGTRPRLTDDIVLRSTTYSPVAAFHVRASTCTSTKTDDAYVRLRSRASFGIITLQLPSFSYSDGLASVGLDTVTHSTYLKASCSGMYSWYTSIVLKPSMICSILRDTKSLKESI